MKRKLVAALLSVAMVASITPVSALGPVASVEAAAVRLYATAAEVESAINALNKSVEYADGAELQKIRASYDALVKDYTGQGAVNVSNIADFEALEALYKQDYTDKISAAETAIAAIPAELAVADSTKIEAARSAYNALATAGGTTGTYSSTTENIQSGVSQASVTKLTNAEAAIGIVEQIEELNVTITRDNYTSNDAKSVTTLNTAFSKLSSEAQAMVGNSSKLKTQVERIAEYTGEVTAYINTVKATITDNAATPTVNTVKAVEADIAEAKKNVEDLAALKAELSSTQQKKAVATDTYVNEYKNNITAAETALDAINKINALPTEIGVKDKAAVEAARTAYNASDSSLIDKDIYAKLQAAELKIKQINLDTSAKKEGVLAVVNEILSRGELTSADKDDVQNAVDVYASWYTSIETTNRDKDLEAARVALLEKWNQVNQLATKDDEAAAKVIVDMIDALPLPANITSGDKAAYEAALKAYNNATTAVQTIVNSTVNKVKINASGTLGTPSQKLNLIKTELGNELKLDAIDRIKELVKALNSDGPLSDKDKYDEIDQLLSTDYKTTYGVTNITTSDMGSLASYYTTTRAKYDANVAADADANGKVTAQSVIELIKNIPTLKADGTDTEADIQAVENAIKAAEDAYAKLDAEGKSHVTNYADIAAAKTKVTTAKVYFLSKDIKTVYGYDITDKTDATTLTEAQVELIEATVKALPATNSSDYKILQNLNTQQELNALTVAKEKAAAYRTAQTKAVNALVTDVNKVKDADIAAMTLENRSNYAAIIKAYEALGAQAKADFAKTDAYAVYQKIAAKYNSFDLANATIKVEAESVVYNGDAQQINVTVTDSLGNVVNPSAYKVTYRDNTDVGTATVKVTGYDDSYTGIQTTTFEITAADINDAEITVSNKTYTGEALTTTVKAIANGDDVLEEGKDFEITSYENNTNIGKATVTIEGKGNYTGTVSKNFIVKPGRVAVTSFKAGTKKAAVKFEGQPNASYKIAYALAGTTQYKYVYTTSLSKTLTGLKSGKKYKVKVLAYYRVDGKTYYTGYGSYKTVKVK